jgi:diguanylate cyclase (GGDEF)-like protein
MGTVEIPLASFVVASLVTLVLFVLGCVTVVLATRQARSVAWKSVDKILQLKEEVEKYKKLAVRDELTGLLNRRGFRVSLDTVLGSFERGAVESMSVVHIDLNDFKPVNDIFGHDAGDEVLQVFAQILTETTRPTDVVARTGGDEFTIVFPNTKENDIQNIIFRAKSELKKYTYSFSGKEEYRNVNLCFAYGVVTTEDNEKPFRELLHEADRRCEANKEREGKGR